MKQIFAFLLFSLVLFASCSNEEQMAQRALCDCVLESAKTDQMTAEEMLGLYENYFKKHHNVDGSSLGYIRLMEDTLHNPGGPWGGINYPSIRGDFTTDRDSTFACIGKVKMTYPNLDKNGASHYTFVYFDAVRNFESATYDDILSPLKKIAELEDNEIQLARHIFLLTLSPMATMEMPEEPDGPPEVR